MYLSLVMNVVDCKALLIIIIIFIIIITIDDSMFIIPTAAVKVV